MYLDVLVYEGDSELNLTDQIQVPVTLWEQLAGPDDMPTFMRVGGNPVGRIVPAEIQGCRIPTWMWELAGCPVEFVELERVALPIAGTISLKPSGEGASLEEMTAALSGSWSCLSVGAELALACGVYDVIAIQAADGTDVPAACILDCDVNLDLVASCSATEEPEPEEIDFSQMFTPPKATGAFTGKGHRLG
jgi:hypothetical protein